MWVWITSFVLLFGLAEAYQWLKHLSLPLPIFLLGGTFLAVISNQSKRLPFGLNFDALRGESEEFLEITADEMPPRLEQPANPSGHDRSSFKSLDLPNFGKTQTNRSNPRSISFDIKKPGD